MLECCEQGFSNWAAHSTSAAGSLKKNLSRRKHMRWRTEWRLCYFWLSTEEKSEII